VGPRTGLDAVAIRTNPCSSLGAAKGWIFVIATASRPALGRTQPPFQWVLRV
jgi:hypothetical protein